MTPVDAPSVLVFDVNETLIDITSLEPHFDRLFGDKRVMREWFDKLVLYSMTVTIAGTYLDFFSLGRAVLRMIGDGHGVAVTDDDLEELARGMQTMPAHADVAEALTKLKAKGFRLVALTNSPPIAGGSTPLANAGLADLFEKQFSVDSWRAFKPAPQLYTGVAAELGVDPSQCMMVAAHVWDTTGAQAAGFRAALITRAGTAPLPTPAVPQPDIVVPDLLELVQQLEPPPAAPVATRSGPAVVREQEHGETMRAIVLEQFGGLDSYGYVDIPKPLPKPGEVVIAVKAFGINHAELHMRRGEWAEAAEVSGIECVGVVDSCPSGEFPVGTRVAALMGGMGRTINGSYAEYTRIPVANVAAIESELPWSQLAALPESYATAWTCLFRNIDLKPGQTIVIRGATSSFGQAAAKMALNADARVIATTRSRDRFPLLEQLGVSRVVVEKPVLAPELAASGIDAVLDLVGNSTILDSLDMLRRDGTACLAGWLGGLEPIGDFNPLLRMASGVNLSFFGSFVFGSPAFPLSDVPLSDIARQVQSGQLDAKPSQVFRFDQIREAHQLMESGAANGKIVVTVP
jgi:2-haloalkanoic acid dehalogenase type II